MLDCPKCDVSAYDGVSCSACGFTVGKPKPVVKNLAAAHKEASVPVTMTRAEWDATRAIGLPILAEIKRRLR